MVGNSSTTNSTTSFFIVFVISCSCSDMGIIPCLPSWRCWGWLCVCGPTSVELLLEHAKAGRVQAVLEGEAELACVKGLVAKALGLAIIAGSCILKVVGRQAGSTTHPHPPCE